MPYIGYTQQDTHQTHDGTFLTNIHKRMDRNSCLTPLHAASRKWVINTTGNLTQHAGTYIRHARGSHYTQAHTTQTHHRMQAHTHVTHTHAHTHIHTHAHTRTHTHTHHCYTLVGLAAYCTCVGGMRYTILYIRTNCKCAFAYTVMTASNTSPPQQSIYSTNMYSTNM